MLQVEQLENRLVPSAVFMVTTIADNAPGAPVVAGSLRAAVNAVNAAADVPFLARETPADGTPVIQFDPGLFGTAQTIYLNQPLELSHSAVVAGPGESLLTLDGSKIPTLNGGVWQIYFLTGATFDPLDEVDISAMSVANTTKTGSAGGAAVLTRITPVCLDGMCLEDNSASIGGAVVTQGGALMIDDCMFKGNHAGIGGAVYAYGPSALTITDSTFTGNVATQRGGAIDAAGVSLAADGCVFNGNTAPKGYGGAIWLAKLTSFDDAGSTFLSLGDTVIRSRY